MKILIRLLLIHDPLRTLTVGIYLWIQLLKTNTGHQLYADISTTVLKQHYYICKSFQFVNIEQENMLCLFLLS